MMPRFDYSGTWSPHPWDEVGPPPPFGRSYEVESGMLLDPAIEEEVRRLIRLGEDAYQRADELEEEAHEERATGDDYFDDAQELIEDKIKPALPDLAAELSKAAYK